MSYFLCRIANGMVYRQQRILITHYLEKGYFGQSFTIKKTSNGVQVRKKMTT